MWAGYHKGGNACGFPPTKTRRLYHSFEARQRSLQFLAANSLFRSDEEGTILQRFRDMGGQDPVSALEVGDGPGHPQDPVVASGSQPET